MRTRTLVIGGVAAAVIAGGTGVALAQGSDDDRSLTQPTISSSAPTTPSTTTSTSIPNGGVSSEDAQRIARDTAGAPNATVTKVEREIDGGLDVWEIELREGSTEWDFDVIVATGEIREWDRDIDDRHDDRDDRDDDRHGDDD